MALLSEYGISGVDRAIHLNREFRKRGWIQTKDELGLETLDCGACRAFAVADHQIAHIYINDDAVRDELIELLDEDLRLTQDLLKKKGVYYNLVKMQSLSS